MNPSFQFLLLCVFSIIIAGIAISSDVVLTSARELAVQRPAGRSLLSIPSKQDVELVAAPNGTVYLLYSDSRKVIWSFPSGPPIYSSYQAPIRQDDEKNTAVGPGRHSFVDCGDDWALYLNNQYGKLSVMWHNPEAALFLFLPFLPFFYYFIQKLGGTIQDYVKRTPIYEEDEVTVGSMHSTVYKVDLWTGKLIYHYGKSASSNASQGSELTVSRKGEMENSDSPNEKGSDMELYIERIDYSLSTKAFDKLLWNLTIGFFKAKLRCKGIEHLVGGASLSMDHRLGSGSDDHRIVSLPCEYEFTVRRFRKQSVFEYFLRLDGMPDSLKGLNMPPADAHSEMLSFPHEEEKGLSAPHHIPFRPTARDILEIHTSTSSSRVGVLSILRRYGAWSFVLLALVLIGLGVHNKRKLLSVHPAPSKKKRSRKSGKSMSALEEGQRNENVLKRRMNLNDLVQGDTDGRTIGRLFVSNREIAKGSNGTVVYEGFYEGRKVAVKRLVQAHHDVAFKEIQNLIASDRHPNIVRWYGVEYDHDFVYLSLEHCSCSLNDLIEAYTNSCRKSLISLGATAEHNARIKSVKATMQDIKLWKSNGCTSALLLRLMRDVVSGLVHLHELGIIHRDIKPQNVLISKGKTLCAKLSDMGISKRLPADMSSLGQRATGHGSSGWQAPEQLLHGRQTRAVDMFSLGCVFFFCVTGGRHPFGDRFERDANIIRNQVDLFLVEHIPEALDLISRLLQPDPQLRPKALQVLHHPFFWNSAMRLSFLHDTSDRVELEDREANSDILTALESVAPIAVGTKWDEKMDVAFINDIGRYRRYKYDSVRHLLRVMRNKLNHYRELPAEIQGLLGTVPDGFDEYFSSRFPRLLIEVYKVVCKYCRTEEWFQKYLQGTGL